MAEHSALDLVLTSPRLRFAAPAAADAADTAAGMTPGIARRLVSWPSPMSETQALERIRACREEMQTGAALHFVLRTSEDDVFVGWTSVWPDERGEEWQLGFWLAEPFQGRGLGLEAAATVVGHLRAAIGPHRLCAAVQPDNPASIAILRRLGMRPAGTMVLAAVHRGREEPYLLFARDP